MFWKCVHINESPETADKHRSGIKVSISLMDVKIKDVNGCETLFSWLVGIFVGQKWHLCSLRHTYAFFFGVQGQT